MIARPIQDVFAFLSHLENIPKARSLRRTLLTETEPLAANRRRPPSAIPGW
jgi:plasmid stabilization system protein ParE